MTRRQIVLKFDSTRQKSRQFPDRRMLTGIFLALLGGLTIVVLQSRADEPAAKSAASTEQQARSKRLLALNVEQASAFTFYRDTARREKLDFRREPVYIWTNLVRNGGQTGAVFVWTWQGRPEVVGSVHSNPAEIAGKRALTHEMHSLSSAVLIPVHDGAESWQPRAGLALKTLPDAPRPAATARQRLAQMRELSRSFSARSIDNDQQTWELRMLAQPLFRYEQSESADLDGGLFAFVTSAGTDPEVVIVLESRWQEQGAEWKYAVCRFSDLELHVEYKGAEVWSSIRSTENPWEHGPQHLYRLMRAGMIDEFSDGDR
jgi:hypothetical protein